MITRIIKAARLFLWIVWLFAFRRSAAVHAPSDPAPSGLFRSFGVYLDTTGVYYLADQHVIRRFHVDTQHMEVIAGSDAFQGSIEDQIPATMAYIANSQGIAGDGAGNIYFSEVTGCRIRVLTAGSRSRTVSTIAGQYQQCISNGDGHLASKASVSAPLGMHYFPRNRVLYFAEQQRVRFISNNTIHTLIPFISPSSLFINQNMLYVADTGHCTVQRAALADPAQLTVIAGTGACASGSDGQNALQLSLYYPKSICDDGQGGVYVVEADMTLRRVTADGAMLIVQHTRGLQASCFVQYQEDARRRLVAGDPTGQPSSQPSGQPSVRPVRVPSAQPSRQPSTQPSTQPQRRPSSQPSRQPSTQPSAQPVRRPSSQPTRQPSRQPTSRPSMMPTAQPVASPTSRPSEPQTDPPTSLPSSQPSFQPTSKPSVPTSQPTSQPSTPTGQPSRQPSSRPSRQPIGQPTGQPSRQPYSDPTGQPSRQPTSQPSRQPSSQPTKQPFARPTGQPSRQPSSCPTSPTSQPSQQPSRQPTNRPTAQPTKRPSTQPSSQPSRQPSCQPTRQPSTQPTRQPVGCPTGQPSSQPSRQPSSQPSCRPTTQPSSSPSRQPSSQPSLQPFARPSGQPSRQPSMQPTNRPTRQPSSQPSRAPSCQPTSEPSRQPSSQPSRRPSMQPSSQPSRQPSSQPSMRPSCQPSTQPSMQPSAQPTQPTSQPTQQPTGRPSRQPTAQPSACPSNQPTSRPSRQPTGQPSSRPSTQPSMQPSRKPSGQPSSQPSTQPSRQPTSQPSIQPSMQPSSQPSSRPSCQPSAQPSSRPSAQPSMQPSRQPSRQPSVQPSARPTNQPSCQPTARPSTQPSRQPTQQPSCRPSAQPSRQPSAQPTSQPSNQPSSHPTRRPSGQPSAQPSVQPSSQPSAQPSQQPTKQPTSNPSVQPSAQPSEQPSRQPSCQPSSQPTTQPSSRPSRQPSSQPSFQPSAQPSSKPTVQPSGQPTMQPSRQPTSQPSGRPTCQPSAQPSRQPTGKPSVQPSNQPSRQPSVQPSSQPSLQPSHRPTTQPSAQPSAQPSRCPSRQPTAQPSTQPSVQPSVKPTVQPSGRPSRQPSCQPSRQPSVQPSARPSNQPSAQPSLQPSRQPTSQPTNQPSRRPSSQPTRQPSSQPSNQPTSRPSCQPSRRPTSQPSRQPTRSPTVQPSYVPSGQPSCTPSGHPSAQPTHRPSSQPTRKPSSQPTRQPSARPSSQPSRQPSNQPSSQPSRRPTSQPSVQPSRQPSMQPSRQPSVQPSVQPSSHPSVQPSARPTAQPSRQPTQQPTIQPSRHPSSQPSGRPSAQPSRRPSSQPTCQPTAKPSRQPSAQPSRQPSVRPSRQPSSQPSSQPSAQPSRQPSNQPSLQPSIQPTVQPSARPSNQPSSQPTKRPTSQPSRQPSVQPSVQPSRQPSNQPSGQPSRQPSSQPSVQPSTHPTSRPSGQPSNRPTAQPSAQPNRQPTLQPSRQPTSRPSAQPSMQPSRQPSTRPSSQPSRCPTVQPSGQPSRQPTLQPTVQPSRQPTARPSTQPTMQPSDQPSSQPTRRPSAQPSTQPSGQPSRQPSGQPIAQPTTQPSSQPSKRPSSQPSVQPSNKPSTQPSRCPSVQPSAQPSKQPSVQPSSQPSRQPSSQPTVQPSQQPSQQPSEQPSHQPSAQPSGRPSVRPSSQPTGSPSTQPSGQPSHRPSVQPTVQPTMQPSRQPTHQPSSQPTRQPSATPSGHPSGWPSAQPSEQPSGIPSAQPTKQPSTQPSVLPSSCPTRVPTAQPSYQPNAHPSQNPFSNPSAQPSAQPTVSPSSVPSRRPSGQPSSQPSLQPSVQPSKQPTQQPSSRPSSIPTNQPSDQPSRQPSSQPTNEPSVQPSAQPSSWPSVQPSRLPSAQPSRQPTAFPSNQPSGQPSSRPSRQPSAVPTAWPSAQPTRQPSGQPSQVPNAHPSGAPSVQPTGHPSSQPSVSPTYQPIGQPSSQPTMQPTMRSTGFPSTRPSCFPSSQPSRKPSSQPTSDPTAQPSRQPTALPSCQPTTKPSVQPSSDPSSCPSAQPVGQPSSQPTSLPTAQPTSCPSQQPTTQPSNRPTVQPTSCPTKQPSAQPTLLPTVQPSQQPTSQPSQQPSRQPTSIPSWQPSSMPTRQPSAQPIGRPSRQPTSRPTARPSWQPRAAPSGQPTVSPTNQPSTKPSKQPFSSPTGQPSDQPTVQPIPSPTAQPFAYPSSQPSDQPSSQPSRQPLSRPSSQPSSLPSTQPTCQPTLGTIKKIAIVSAVFAADGQSITVSLNRPTNMAGSTGSNGFSCDSVLSFSSASSYVCLWSGSSVIVILGTTKPALTVGSPVSFTANSKLLVQCSPSYCPVTALDTAVVSIALPAVVSQPSIGAFTSANITNCSAWQLDFSVINENAGRLWTNVSFQVQSLVLRRNMTQAVNTIYSQFSKTSLVVVDNSLIRGGDRYSVRVSLCNFLGGCAAKTMITTVATDFTVSAPVVSMTGVGNRSIRANSILTVTSSAYTVGCNNQRNSGGLQYIWKLQRLNTTTGRYMVLSLPSQSKQDNMFILPALSLTPNKVYLLQLLVKDARSGLNTSSAVPVTVLPSDLIANVVPTASQQLLRVGGILMLNASGSYDPDRVSKLSFRWSCRSRNDSVDVMPCALNLNPSNGSSSVLFLSPNVTAVNTTSTLSLLVFESVPFYTTRRNATSSVEVKVIQADKPLIKMITSAGDVSYVNVDSRLSLYSTVWSPNACNATWMMKGVRANSNSTNVLSAKSIPALRLMNVNLYLPTYALIGGTSYAFTIACGSSAVAITVTTNNPPRGGRLNIQPERGFALNTTFLLYSDMWLESDLPLSYIFTFLSTTDGVTYMPLRGLSEIASASVLLPFGSDNSSNVMVSVVAQDVFRSQGSRVVSAVSVQPLKQTAMSSIISSYLSRNLSMDSLQNIISVSTSVMNTADCSKTPNCSALHRAACRATANTCGACLSGYLTVENAGDNNNPCISSVAIANFTAAPRTCTTGGCAAWQTCNNATKQCVDRSKTCSAANCSSHGTCTFFSTTNKVLPTCSLISASCDAVCVCNTGYAGGDCSLTTAEQATEQLVRIQLLNGLSNVMSNSDSTDASLSSAAASLAAIVRNKYDISSDSANQVANLANNILTQSLALNTQLALNLADVLDPVDAVLSSLSRSPKGNGSSSVAGTSSAALTVFQGLLTQEQQPFDAVYDTFRVSSSVIDNTQPTASGTINVAIALTDQEKLLQSTGQLTVPSVNIAPTSSNSSVYVAVMIMDKETWKSNNTNLASDVVSVQATNVEFVDIKMSIKDFVQTPPINYTIDCPPRIRIKKNFTCIDSGTLVKLQCNGTAGVYAGTCPVLRSTCSSLSLPGQVADPNQQCFVVNATETTITCRCTMGSTTGVGVVAAGLVVKYVGSDLARTFQASSSFSNASAVGKAYILITLYGGLWGCSILFMLFYGWGYAERQQKRKDEHVKKKDDLQQKRRSLEGLLRRNSQAVAADEVLDQGTIARQKLAHYISSIFPTIFEAKTALSGLHNELTKHHMYVKFFFHMNESRAPVLSVVEMMTMQSFLLFLLALLYDLNYPDDDGSCVNFTNIDTCLARKYMLDSSQSYCNWVDDESVCEYAQPSFSVTTAMYISMLISLATCLVTGPMETLIEYLAAPSSLDEPEPGAAAVGLKVPWLSKTVGVAPSDSPTPSMSSGSAKIVPAPALGTTPNAHRMISMRYIPDEAIAAHMEAIQYAKQITAEAAPLLERRDHRRQHLAKKISRRMLTSKHSMIADEAALVPLSVEALQHDILLQRQLMKVEHRHRFDELWGLHAYRGTFLQRDYIHWWTGKKVFAVQDVVVSELHEVNKEADEMIKELADASEVDRGFEILQMFIIDLLGRNSPAARIFASKAELDFEKVITSSLLMKLVIALFIVMINLFFIYYTILKGYSKGVQWQQDYLRQWGIQIILDIFIFETIQCMWIHFSVPYLVSKEVHQVYALLQQTIEHLCDGEYFEKTAMCLNTADYLFVSQRLAAAYPDLLESTIVRAYSSHLPGEAGKAWLEKLKRIDQQEKRLKRRFTTWHYLVSLLPSSLFVTFLVQIAAYAPMELQRTVIRVLEPMLLSGLTFGFYLFIEKPVFIVVFIVAIAGLTGLLMWDYFRVKKAIQMDTAENQIVEGLDDEPAAAAGNAVAPAPVAGRGGEVFHLDLLNEYSFDSFTSSEEDGPLHEAVGWKHKLQPAIKKVAKSMSDDSEEQDKDDEKPPFLSHSRRMAVGNLSMADLFSSASEDSSDSSNTIGMLFSDDEHGEDAKPTRINKSINKSISRSSSRSSRSSSNEDAAHILSSSGSSTSENSRKGGGESSHSESGSSDSSSDMSYSEDSSSGESSKYSLRGAEGTANKR